jgi:hypothetical protein
MRQARTRKVVATQRRETQTLTKKKKNTDPEKKRKKKSIWSSRGSTSRPSQKTLGAALWTTDASRFGLFIPTLTTFQFI